MEKNIETLATALYVKIDDMLTEEPGLALWRPEGSIPVTASDSELLTMAVMSALPGFRSERRWLRYSGGALRHLFPRQAGQSGYNKRIRKMIFLLMAVIRRLAADTSLWTDDVWIVDSTPMQCGCSRETVRRSDAAGRAEYGYCASHSRYFRSLRLHLVCTLQGLPVMFAVAGAKACEREVLPGMPEIDAALVASRGRAPNADSAREMNSSPWAYMRVQIVQFGAAWPFIPLDRTRERSARPSHREASWMAVASAARSTRLAVSVTPASSYRSTEAFSKGPGGSGPRY